MENTGLLTILIITILTILLLFTILIFPGGMIGEVWGAQETGIKPPETLEEARERSGEIVEEAKDKIPGIMKKIWDEETMPVWRKMWDWTKNWWQKTIWPWIDEFFQKKIKSSLEEEIEKRKPIIKEEFEKEKQEFKKRGARSRQISLGKIQGNNKIKIEIYSSLGGSLAFGEG